MAQLERYYDLNYTIVSLVFLSPLVGYTASALLNNLIHMKIGQRGIALIGPGAHLTAYIVIAVHPPYPVLVVVFILAGFGNGIEDAAWNAWIGDMASANEILGFLHGFYGLGATMSPLIATTMVTKGDLGWYTFYYIMIGGAAIELVASLSAFWPETGAKFRAANPRTTDSKGGRTREALTNRVTWICSLFLLAYVGVEVALGGWIVTFMIQVRRGTPFASGISATGFWLGITAGRVVLGFVTPRLGEKLAITVSRQPFHTYRCLTFPPSPSTKRSKSETNHTPTRTDLPHLHRRARADLLAPPALRRLRRRRRPPRLLPRPHVPRRRHCRHQAPAQTPSRQRHRLRRRVRQRRRLRLALRRRRHRPGQGRSGPAAHRAGDAGRLYGAVGAVAQLTEGACSLTAWAGWRVGLIAGLRVGGWVWHDCNLGRKAVGD